MKKNISQELKNIFEDLQLDEASMNKIIELFDDAVQTKVDNVLKENIDAALQKQDDIYSDKLTKFIEQIDVAHSQKLQELNDLLDTVHTNKLKKLYESVIVKNNKDLSEFKENLLKTVQVFIEMYISKTVPTKAINESIKVRKNQSLINELRKMLSIDAASEKQAIKEGIIDAKKIIDESKKTINVLHNKNKLLSEHLEKMKRDNILESKLKNVDASKRNQLRKIYQNSTIEQINEGFDYSSKLIDRARRELKEDAKNNFLNEKKNTIPFETNKIINENIKNERNDIIDDYVSILENS